MPTIFFCFVFAKKIGLHVDEHVLYSVRPCLKVYPRKRLGLQVLLLFLFRVASTCTEPNVRMPRNDYILVLGSAIMFRRS
ncbi:hypothetical protein BDA96_03G327200 [Sorghum bicolor]|uniref:Uncharacterized protein n=1 Tax=Sorghum bicolor TaxID=4558 RepID=A0A921UPB6_SORBI|nr:hypothetical protein BDA96_03G327200 [Sorghum bicolor]